MTFPIISADSHITEAPNTYVDYIDAKWRDKAPHIVDAGERGDLYVIDGMKSTISMGLVAAAGKSRRNSPSREPDLTISTEAAGTLKRAWRIRIRMECQPR